LVWRFVYRSILP